MKFRLLTIIFLSLTALFSTSIYSSKKNIEKEVVNQNEIEQHIPGNDGHTISTAGIIYVSVFGTIGLSLLAFGIWYFKDDKKDEKHDKK